MMSLIPTWIVEFRTIRPTLVRPGGVANIRRIEAAALTREEAAHAVRRKVDGWCEILSVSVGSPTGMA